MNDKSYFSMFHIKPGRGSRFDEMVIQAIQDVADIITEDWGSAEIIFTEYDPYRGLYFNRVTDRFKNRFIFDSVVDADIDTIFKKHLYEAIGSEIQDAAHFQQNMKQSIAWARKKSLSPFDDSNANFMMFLDAIVNKYDDNIVVQKTVDLQDFCFYLLQAIPQSKNVGFTSDLYRNPTASWLPVNYNIVKREGFPILRAIENIFGIEKLLQGGLVYGLPILDERRFFGGLFLFLPNDVKLKINENYSKRIKTLLVKKLVMSRFAKFTAHVQMKSRLSDDANFITQICSNLPELADVHYATSDKPPNKYWRQNKIQTGYLPASTSTTEILFQEECTERKRLGTLLDYLDWSEEHNETKFNDWLVNNNFEDSAVLEYLLDKPEGDKLSITYEKYSEKIPESDLKDELKSAIALLNNGDNLRSMEYIYGKYCQALLDFLAIPHKMQNATSQSIIELLQWFSFTQSQDLRYVAHSDESLSKLIYCDVVSPIAILLEIEPEIMQPIKQALEYEGALKRIPSYRDHFIHAFHVFVLGYLLIEFMGNEMPGKPLYDLKADDEKSYKDLLKDWFITAFWHDAAYIFMELEKMASNYFTEFTGIKTSVFDGVKEDEYSPIALNFAFFYKVFPCLKEFWSLIEEMRGYPFWYSASKAFGIDHGLISALMMFNYYYQKNPDWKQWDLRIKKIIMAIAEHHSSNKWVDYIGVINRMKTPFEAEPLSWMMKFCDAHAEWGRSKLSEPGKIAVLKSISFDQTEFSLWIAFPQSDKPLEQIIAKYYGPLREQLILSKRIKFKATYLGDDNKYEEVQYAMME